MKKFYFLFYLLLISISNAQNAADVEHNFSNPQGFNAEVTSIALQTDGKILVGGNFTSYQGNSENRIIRLNSDGSKDASFDIGTGFNGGLTTITIQTDGKIIVGGYFTTYQGNTENYIIRLNSDGSKDTTFDSGSGFSANLLCVALQSDGKIIVGGQFSIYQGVSQFRIIRLNNDGSLDTTFNIGSGFNGVVTSIIVQNDEKIVLGGGFYTYKGITENRILRLNNDGSKDNTFNTGSGFNFPVNSMAMQKDGKFIVGGYFKSYQGSAESGIIRLNTDGSKDTSFNTSTGTNNSIYAIELQTNGKIVIGGTLTTYKGVTENRIICLNSDGSKDTSFNSGTGFDNQVDAIKIQNDGKIIVAGNFSTYNGNNLSPYLIRLKGDTNLSSPVFNKKENLFSIWPNPVENNLNINSLNYSVPSATIYDLQGKLLYSKQTDVIDVSGLHRGIYFIKLKNESGETTQKFIKQ